MNAAMISEEQNHKVRDLPADTLIDHAHNILVRDLEGFGSRLTQGHFRATRNILSTCTKMAYGVTTGWYAIPLGTGMGKTQSIVAWATALHQLGYDDVSMVVCASQVEALCDMKRAMITKGVPEEKIGLWHSYPFDPEKAEEYMNKERADLKGYASLPSTTDHQSKQILLVTHNRLRGSNSLESYNMFQGKPRDLIIWDESLFVSDSWAIETWKLESAAGGLSKVPGEGKRPLLVFLNECVSLLRKEEAEQQAGRRPQLVYMPRLTNDELDSLRESVPRGLWGEEIRAFIDISQYPLRLYQGQQSSLITYQVVVDPSIQNIVILDASHNIRKLCHVNEAITSLWTHNNQRLVSYENVTIHQLLKPSGRNSIEKYTAELRKEDSGVLKEVVEVVKLISKGEAVVIFTFKQRSGGRDHIKALRKSLAKNGIDADEMIDVEEEGKTTHKRRINFLTWGNECSLNRFSYCSNVVLAGVLHRNPHELASKIAGEKNDLSTRMPWKQVMEIQTSEVCHCIYQALSRGSCRIIENGKAGRMNAWLIHGSTDIRDTINEAMPGVRWVEWKPKHLMAKTKTGVMVEQIVSHLRQLAYDTTKVSTQQIKKDLSIPANLKSNFTRALRTAADTAGWIVEGRSLIRVGALFTQALQV